MAYSKKVVDKFENTLNNPQAFKVGRFDPSEVGVGTGMVGAPACGDVMKLQIKCEPQGNTHIIKDVKFKTYGCGSAIASSSELVEMLIGKTLEEAKEIKNKEIVDALELPPIKIHCSVLAEDSIKQAIEDYESKQ
jgi:nitrogen fixation NifU-like protein